jgi:hypothetical protein
VRGIWHGVECVVSSIVAGCCVRSVREVSARAGQGGSDVRHQQRGKPSDWKLLDCPAVWVKYFIMMNIFDMAVYTIRDQRAESATFEQKTKRERANADLRRLRKLHR